MSTAPENTTPEAPAADRSAGLPRVVLVAAGLTVLNGLLSAGFMLAWLLDRATGIAAVRASGGAGLLLGMVGVCVGAWLQYKQKRSGETQPGAGWSTGAVLAGLAATGVFLFIPMMAAINAMLGSPG